MSIEYGWAVLAVMVMQFPLIWVVIMLLELKTKRTEK